MPELMTLRSDDEHVFTAWNSTPAKECKGGVIVLHAVFGLTSHIEDVCDTWAAAGFRAIAPALFDRIGKAIVHPYGRAGADAGTQTYGRLTQAQILADIQACQQELASCGQTAITGFCTGGSWAWTAAAHLTFDAQVAFYGSHIHERLGQRPLCPTQLHYGSSDHVVSTGQQEQIEQAHPQVEMNLYPSAGHAFMNPDQEYFAPDAAAVAWRRAISFVGAAFSAPGARRSSFI